MKELTEARLQLGRFLDKCAGCDHNGSAGVRSTGGGKKGKGSTYSTLQWKKTQADLQYCKESCPNYEDMQQQRERIEHLEKERRAGRLLNTWQKEAVKADRGLII